VLLGFQIGGESQSGAPHGWKHFDVDQIRQLRVSQQCIADRRAGDADGCVRIYSDSPLRRDMTGDRKRATCGISGCGALLLLAPALAAAQDPVSAAKRQPDCSSPQH
jgi:hypothetical protein